jgi:hypothetical protein
MSGMARRQDAWGCERMPAEHVTDGERSQGPLEPEGMGMLVRRWRERGR